jgi:glycerophosphoryl diester phosphodiesterase
MAAVLAACLWLVAVTTYPRYPPLTSGDTRFVVVSHRGFSGTAPENTLPAIKRALAVHSGYVEIDVQRTKDGRLVLLHDLTLARTTNVATVFPRRRNDPVGTFTLAQIKLLDAGSWMGPGFAGTRVPTLDQVISVVAPTRMKLMLELKHPSHYPGYEAQIARALAAHHLGGRRVVVHSFSTAALHEFHRVAPKIPLGVLLPAAGSDPGRYGWAQVLEPEVGHFSESFVDHARALHKQVFAWDSNNPSQMEQLADWGVNGVTTDRPDIARAELAHF